MWAPGNGQAEPAPLPDPISNTGAPPHWRGAKWRAVRETSAKLAAEPIAALPPALLCCRGGPCGCTCNREGLGPGPSGPRGCVPGWVRPGAWMGLSCCRRTSGEGAAFGKMLGVAHGDEERFAEESSTQPLPCWSLRDLRLGVEAWEMDATSAQSFGAAGCENGGYLTYQKR